MNKILEKYSLGVSRELEDILRYWMDFTVDHEHGGFIGRIDHYNIKYPDAPKGSVLNSRILWTFSAAYKQTNNHEYLKIVDRAFHYISHHFIDPTFGGVYWTVNFKGKQLNTRKQIYALAFAIYGLSEYYIATGNETAKIKAIEIYETILRYSYDEKHGGYFEALSRDWNPVEDLRLSEKDANERKTMNTHLHVLEAFSNLYKCWPGEGLKEKITELIQIFLFKIISPKTNHLILFFEDDWTPKSSIVSFGHDIEAAWLLQEAAETIGDKNLLQLVKDRSLLIAQAALEGMDEDGGLWYEYDPENNHMIKQKHSWPQAEAMIGFFNAWQISGDKKWLDLSLKSWAFINDFIKDKPGDEWLWGIEENFKPMIKEDKVGIWKCPYHNSRACMEIIKRINETMMK